MPGLKSLLLASWAISVLAVAFPFIALPYHHLGVFYYGALYCFPIIGAGIAAEGLFLYRSRATWLLLPILPTLFAPGIFTWLMIACAHAGACL